MKAIKKHKIGQKCNVEVYNSSLNKSELILGEVLGTVSAIDREYRVNVRLIDGREFEACAPECIIIITKKI